MSKHVINVELSTQGVNQALKELAEYKAQLKKRVAALVATLTDMGVEIAKAQVMSLGAVYTGNLESSIQGYYSPGTGVGIIQAGAWYAAFIEFGTGIMGAGSPHPAPEGWAYDVNGHGDAGWWYYDSIDDQWHWTQGQAARPFMYNTARELERICVDVARSVFS